MNLSVFLYIIIALNTLIGVFVLTRNRKSKVNISLSLFIFSISGWVLSSVMAFASSNVVWARLSFVTSLSLVFFCLMFLQYFLKNILKKGEKSFVYLLFSTILLGIGLSATSLLVEKVLSAGSIATGITLKMGVFYPIVIAIYVIAITFGFYMLIVGYNRSSGLQKLQTRYLLFSIIIFALSAISTNLILPYFGVFGLNGIGLSFSFILSCGMAYAIVKHRLMDIGLAVIRSLSFSTMIIVFVAILAGSTFGVSLFTKDGLFTPFQASLIAFVIAMAFWPLRIWITKVTDKIFYKRTYDPEALLDAISKKISSTLVLKDILGGVNQLLSIYMKLSGCAFILFDEDGKVIKEDRLKTKDFNTTELYSLVRKGVLVCDDLDDGSDEKTLLQNNNVSLFQPIYNGKKLVGIFVSGEKDSGNLFNSQDIRVLSITAQSIAVAIENAKSYEQIEAFNVTLRQKIAEATQELRVKNAMLKKLDKAKDEFVSMASHQLRTPLTSVKGYLSMVVEGDAGKVNKQQKELLDEAYSSNERMVNLVNDFLNVSRIQTGKFMLEKVPVDLTKLVDQEVKGLVQNATKRQIKLDYKASGDIPQLNLDEGKIRQVVMNYIDNAIYYSNPDSTIKIDLSADSDEVVFTVKDTGIGVPISEQGQLFTKFYRASNAKKQRPDGTGVGLYLARKIVTAHDGKIVFSTVEGKGSTFGFRLPIKELELSAEKEIKNLKD